MAFNFMNAQKIIDQIQQRQDKMIRKSLKMVSDPMYIEVGWFDPESGKYPEEESGAKVVDVARIHEFGLGGFPAKAFVRLTVDENNKEWAYEVQKAVNVAIAKAKKGQSDLNSFNKHALLYTIGEQIKQDLRDRIEDIDLIDTSRLLNSILIKFKRK